MGIARVDVAISSDGLLALVPGLGSTVTVDAALDPRGDKAQEPLVTAFSRLEQGLLKALGLSAAGGGSKFLVRVAILPPLCEVRLIEMPTLDDEETELVVRRSASKHFIGSARDLVIACTGFPHPESAGVSTVLAAAAPGNLLEAIRVAVESRGWEVESFVPAQAAWLHALERTIPAGGKRHGAGAMPTRAIVASDARMATVIRLAGDAPTALRRIPITETAAIVDAMGSIPGRAIIVVAEGRAELAARLRERGWIIEEADRLGASAMEAAARGIEGATLELVPLPVIEARRVRARERAGRMLMVTAILVIAAGVLHLVNLGRQIRAVEQERAELRPRVMPVAAARDSLDAMYERLRQLRELEGTARAVTVPLVELSVLLPPETYVVSLRVAGDTAVFEAAGGRAGTALAALRNATTLRDVRLEGAIQREIEGGATSEERFTLSALLASAPRAEQAGGTTPFSGGSQ